MTATVALLSEVSVSLVKYVEVAKRPVNLNVTVENIGYQNDSDYMYLYPSADTFVRSDSDNSYGSDSRLIIGSDYPAEWTRTYLRFDIPPLAPDASLGAAMLYLDNLTAVNYEYYPNDPEYGQVRCIGIYRVTQPWNESDLTRYFMPSYDPSEIFSIAPWESDDGEFSVSLQSLVEQWANGTVPNYGVVLRDETETRNYSSEMEPIQFTLYSNETQEPNYVPRLQLWYRRPEFRVSVNVTDPVIGGRPIPGLNVTFGNDPPVQTNPYGVATTTAVTSVAFAPVGILRVQVASQTTSIHAASNANVNWDSRWETQLDSLNYNGTAKIGADVSSNFDFRLTSPHGGAMPGLRVDFYVDREYRTSLFTDANGGVRFTRTFTQGTHYIDANFFGNQSYRPEFYGDNSYYYDDWWRESNTTLAVIAAVVPLGIEFSVSPETFNVGDRITLQAKVYNMTDNTLYLPSSNVNFIEVTGNNVTTKPPWTNNTIGGITPYKVDYPNDYVAAYRAAVVTVPVPGSPPQNLASSTVQLTVGKSKETRLLLSVTRDFNSTRHVFNLSLLNGASPVLNKPVKLKLNETEYSSNTGGTGTAQIVLYLSPQKDNTEVNFSVVANFSGDQPSVARASMALPDGTDYDICTTLQYNGFQPSSNSTMITVLPQTTTGATTLMSQEQMQKKAQDDGWHAKSYNELKQNEVCR